MARRTIVRPARPPLARYAAGPEAPHRWWIETDRGNVDGFVAREYGPYWDPNLPRLPAPGTIPCYVGVGNTAEWLRVIWEEAARTTDDRRRRPPPRPAQGRLDGV